MIYESLIFSFFTKIVLSLYGLLKESIFYRISVRLVNFIRKLFSESKIWSFVKRPDFYSKVTENSIFLIILDRGINFPTRFCRSLHEKWRERIEGSLLLRLTGMLAQQLHLLIGLVLIGTMVIKHDRWNNLYATILVALLLLLYFLKTVMYKQYEFRVVLMDFALVLFSISVLLAEILSPYPVLGLKFLVFYITYFLLLLLIVSEFNTVQKLSGFITILLFGVTLSGLYGLYQYKVGVPVDPSLTDLSVSEGLPGRIFGMLQNPNNLAIFLILFIPMYCAAFLNANRPWKKAIFLLGVLPVIAALFLTGSRGGMGALLIGIFVFLLLKNWRLIPLGMAAGLLMLPLIPSWIFKRFMTIFNSNDSSIDYREKIFLSVKPMLMDFWYSGVGLGTDVFRQILNNYYAFTKSVPIHSHNFYLQICVEIGVVGLIFLLWFLLRIFKKCILKIFEQKDMEKGKGENEKALNNIMIAGIAGLAGVLAMGFFEYIWFYPRNMMYFWVVVAIICAALHLRERRFDESGVFTLPAGQIGLDTHQTVV